MRILLIEDDLDIGDGIERALKRHGYAVDWFTDGKLGQIAVETVDYAIAILDLGLPKVEGLDILAHWRNNNCIMPVLVLTARNSMPERVLGLNSGADDYLGKPFETEELMARLNALLRRQRAQQGQANQSNNELHYGGVSLNTASKVVTLHQIPVILRSKELALLELFLSYPSHIISREQIEDKLYSWDSEVDSNAIQVYIHSLRRKFGKDFICTHRGLGYQLGKQP